MATIIEIIDHLCEGRGIKGSKLCDDLGISRSTLTELRKGRAKSLNIKKATLIANYFGVPVEYLLGEGSGEQTPPETQNMYDVFMQLMEEKGVTAYRVAKDTGITQATLSRWKTGKVSPSIETLQVLAEYFGVTLDYLMGNTHADRDIEEIDIAIELEEMMQKLKSDGSLMFDGNPASPEAIRSIKTALEMGLRYARDVEKGKSK